MNHLTSFSVKAYVVSLLSLSWQAFALPSGQNSQTSLTTLFQNNLNASDDVNHVGYILTDAIQQSQLTQVCSSIDQVPLPVATAQQYSTDLAYILAYQAFSGQASQAQQYYIDASTVSLSNASLEFVSSASAGANLPGLCLNSANTSEPQNSSATATTGISLTAGDNLYNGYFNKKSFRFLGIRYAQQPVRFEQSQMYSPSQQVINATAYGSQCLQIGGGSEDCLFLNVQTPYLPKAGSTLNLRPVMFWIHGGGFTGGTGADPLSDGSNLASREDIVVVTINYRLSALGFLAIPGTDITGNYGIGDQINALQWTIQNIAYFGGDPSQITIIGESAGAGSVRALLGSPKAAGKFQGAVAMSNLGGGQDLGLTSNYGTSYSEYPSIADSYNISGIPLVNATNCTSATLDETISCLRAANATTLAIYANGPRYVVQDNIYINVSHINLVTPNNGTAHVPTIFGNVVNDGASFSVITTANDTSTASISTALQLGLSISASAAESIISSNLFPFANITGNATLDVFNITQRVATDNTFRCIDQATMYAGAVNSVLPPTNTYYYQFERAIAGYNPNNLPGAPIEPGFSNGDPELPYYKLHGADMPFVFGNFYTNPGLRDDQDLYATQLVSGFFGAFMKTGNPNIDVAYLEARGYAQTLQAVQELGTWYAVGTGGEGAAGNVVRHFDYPGYDSDWIDVEQCTWLGYPLNYYVNQ